MPVNSKVASRAWNAHSQAIQIFGGQDLTAKPRSAKKQVQCPVTSQLLQAIPRGASSCFLHGMVLPGLSKASQSMKQDTQESHVSVSPNARSSISFSSSSGSGSLSYRSWSSTMTWQVEHASEPSQAPVGEDVNLLMTAAQNHRILSVP